jgi:hypothetical protein
LNTQYITQGGPETGNSDKIISCLVKDSHDNLRILSNIGVTQVSVIYGPFYTKDSLATCITMNKIAMAS